MISLGNIALSLKDWVLALKSNYTVYFSPSLLPSFSFGSKSSLHVVLVLTWLWSSSSDDGVKNLDSSLTWDGPMPLWGSSLMSCNLSVSESLLFLWRALAFSACTWFLDPMSLGHLWGYSGSGTFAAGVTETGLGWFCGCMATCFSMVIHCCCSLKLSIWLLIMVCPCLSLVPVSKVFKEHSISSSSGGIVHDELAELVVSGLEVFEDGCELLSDDVSDKEFSVPLVLVLSALELPDGELGKDTEDSLVVVSDTGCELADWESLGDGCGSLRSECLVVTLVCLVGMSRSGSVTSSLNLFLFLVEVSHPDCLLGGTATVLLTGLFSNLIFLACLLGWTFLSGTVLVYLILPLHVSERTVFWLLPASCFGPEMSEFSLVNGAFLSISPERTELCCKKEACIIALLRSSFQADRCWNIDMQRLLSQCWHTLSLCPWGSCWQGYGLVLSIVLLYETCSQTSERCIRLNCNW